MLELNFEDLYNRFETLPLRRVRIPGESFWARELEVGGTTYALLANSPLDENYMFFDVAEVRNSGDLGSVVYRPFAEKVWLRYEAAPTEDEDLEVRKKLRDVFVQASRPLMGFFVSGLAYVQCHEADDFAEALTSAGLKTTLNGWTPPEDAEDAAAEKMDP